MEEKEKKVYVCSHCGREDENKAEIEYCEITCAKQKKINIIESLKEFTITANHLKLLKEMYVGWDDCEFGAPSIDPKRPYGNSDVVNDIAEILKMKKTKKNYDFEEETWNTTTNANLYFLHKEMQIVLQITLSTGIIGEGTYIKDDDYGHKWKKK